VVGRIFYSDAGIYYNYFDFWCVIVIKSTITEEKKNEILESRCIMHMVLNEHIEAMLLLVYI